MKISAVPSVLNSMSVPTQQSTNREMPAAVSELPISASNETKEAEATQPLSPQFAELAKRRRALQLQERALKEREKALESLGTGSDRIELAKLKSSPLSVLQEAGVMGDEFYNQLTEHLLANQEDGKYRALEAKLAAIEQGVDKKFTDRETQAEQQALAEMKRDAQSLLAKDDTYELVRETRSIPDVMKLIERTYRETGEVLEVSEALKLVEDHLFEKTNKLANLNKIKSQFIQQAPPAPPPKQQIGMRTLKNTDTAPIASSRRARALAAALGQKQS